jgi:hypothetical protein
VGPESAQDKECQMSLLFWGGRMGWVRDGMELHEPGRVEWSMDPKRGKVRQRYRHGVCPPRT